MNSPAPKSRDLRLDFFRGLSLWFIFINHVPSNVMSWFTNRNYGFSDAAEIFVFISGYTAAFVYGRVMQESGFIIASARILKRVWQLYVAFVFLSVIYIAQTAYVVHRFDNPLYADEMVALHFFQQPEAILLEVLRLRFLLANVNILPLYILLMLAFPLMLWLVLRKPAVAFVLSIALWAAAYFGGLNLKLYPMEQTWFFNPFAWQLLFLIGAWCAVGSGDRLEKILRSRAVLALCIAYLAVACVWNATIYFPGLAREVPGWMLIFPLNKSDLSPLRLAHFLAQAIVVVRLVPADAGFLRTPWAQPLILCGRHSLEVFCLGVFLSLTALFMLSEISGSVAMQVFINLAGIALMVALAALLSWYKSLDRRLPNKPVAT
ncbi:MAG: OpgC domain-containing protein [Bradyrhizobiaceae bacterium]|nr:OpgC domain-containing protein [Bradyrhizobiaceae bacterium]